jgi:hypothetical protein
VAVEVSHAQGRKARPTACEGSATLPTTAPPAHKLFSKSQRCDRHYYSRFSNLEHLGTNRSKSRFAAKALQISSPGSDWVPEPPSEGMRGTVTHYVCGPQANRDNTKLVDTIFRSRSVRLLTSPPLPDLAKQICPPGGWDPAVRKHLPKMSGVFGRAPIRPPHTHCGE